MNTETDADVMKSLIETAWENRQTLAPANAPMELRAVIEDCLDLMEQGLTAEVALAKLAEAGVLLVPFGPTRLRAVTHLDVSEDEVRHAAEVVAEVFGE